MQTPAFWLRCFAVLAIVVLGVGVRPSPVNVRAQTVPTLSVDPSSGPAGATVSVSVVGFDSSQVGAPAGLFLDGQSIGATALVACSSSSDGAGFGTFCNGSALTITLPSTLTVGPHTLSVFVPRAGAASATYTVEAPTATDLPTDTPTPTSVPTDTPTSAPTDTPPPVATDTSVATSTDTAVATPTTTSVASPTDTAVPATGTPTATATPGPSAGLPPAPSCKPAAPLTTAVKAVKGGAGFSSNTRLPGGSIVTVTVTGVRANADTLFLYSGPRADVEGSVITPLSFSPPALKTNAGTYRALARVRASATGTVRTSLVLPVDSAYGTATILAFQAHCLRCKPAAEWRVKVTARNPELVIDGTPGQNVVVTDGDTGAGNPGAAACAAVLGPDGSATVHNVDPGVKTVLFLQDNGVLASTLVVALPNSVTHVSVHLPNLTTTCSTIQFNSVLSSMSGRPEALGGDGPLGYFLSGIPISDDLLIKITQNGHAVDPNLLAQAYVDLVAPNGDVVQHFPITGPTAPTKSIPAWTAAAVDPTSLHLLMGSSSRATDLIDKIDGNLSHQASTFALTYNPGVLPPGTNKLLIDVHGCEHSVPISMVDSGWRGPFFSLSDAPSFNPHSKVYRATGSLPPNAPNFSFPLDPGWDKYGPLPAWHYHIDNILRAGMFLDERFSTAGHWQAAQAQAAVKVELVNNSLVDESYDLGATFHDPKRPGYGVDDVTLAELHYNPSEPIVSIPIFGVRIPYIGGLGFTFDIKFGANGRVFFSGDVNPDLSINQLTLGGTASLTISAGVGLTVLVGGINAGISATFALTVPLSFQSSGGVDVSACFTGTFHFQVTWWYDVWFTSDSGVIFDVPLATFHVPGGCSGELTQRASGAQNLRDAILAIVDVRRARHLATPRYRVIHVTPSASARRPHPASPVMRFDTKGRGMSAWVRSEPNKRRDTLMAAPFSGGRWGTPAPVATSGAAILSPRLAELGDGRATLVWIQNMVNATDAKSMERLRAAGDTTGALQHMIDRQELFSSIYSNGHWSAPKQMTHDQIVDNDPAIVADQSRHQAMVVWTRGNESASRSLVERTLRGTAWSASAAVPGTMGTDPRRVAATLLHGAYLLSWIHGSPAQGRIALASFTGGHWATVRPPALPAGAQEVTLAPAGKGLALAASIVSSTGSSLAVDEPALWGASSAGTSWHVRKLSSAADSPSLDAGPGRPTILTFRQPGPTGSGQSGFSAIEASIVLPGGGFSRPGVLAGGKQNFGMPVTAQASAGSVHLLYQTAPVDAGVAQASSSVKSLTLPGTTTLDPVSGIHAAVVSLTGRPLLNLKQARLSIAHPRPGERVRVTVPLRNDGAGTARIGGRLVVRAGKTVLARLPLSKTLAPYSKTSVTVAVRSTADPITLKASGIRASRGAELGLPIPIARVVASSEADGSISLRWTQPPDHDITGYRIYRATGKTFELVGLSTDTQYVDTAPTADPKTAYAVTAVDKQGRESRLSSAATPAGTGAPVP